MQLSVAQTLEEISETGTSIVDLEFEMRLGILHRKRILAQLDYFCSRQNVTFDWCQRRGNSFMLSMSGRECDLRPIIVSLGDLIKSRR